MKWNQLNNLDLLEQIKEESKSQPIAIFKHSTSCGISRMVLKNFERGLVSKEGINTKLYFLDLLAFRSVSNQVAEVFSVIHESPQLIIIENGAVTHHSSHNSIQPESIN